MTTDPFKQHNLKIAQWNLQRLLGGASEFMPAMRTDNIVNELRKCQGIPEDDTTTHVDYAPLDPTSTRSDQQMRDIITAYAKRSLIRAAEDQFSQMQEQNSMAAPYYRLKMALVNLQKAGVEQETLDTIVPDLSGLLANKQVTTLEKLDVDDLETYLAGKDTKAVFSALQATIGKFKNMTEKPDQELIDALEKELGPIDDKVSKKKGGRGRGNQDQQAGTDE